ncbi:MAG: redoxin domain-containing protein [Xanthomonadaceae bacterium]|nr:redoxin domain-containing protein [Xanthomonadaceae bacterium]MDZ4377067.1 redoxin domain-containing protein [Xanthomonadaceae bacterium]
MDTNKMTAGSGFPAMSWNSVSGERVVPADGSGWRVLIIYRGKHCPLCKAYLNTLDGMLGDFQDADIAVFALSADSKEKAEAEAAECGWKFPVGYGLTVEEMRQLGLYISDPRSPEETDRRFAEPGLFVINPDGNTQIIDISNAPFARPDLESLLKGIQFVMSNDYPIRGRA